MDAVYNHYTEEALKHGAEPNSTMADLNTREKEIAVLKDCIFTAMMSMEHPAHILEIGCGNGYTAERLAGVLPSKTWLECIDYNEDMIKVAKERSLENVRWSFRVGNALQLNNEDESVDIVFTERCLINLLKWEEQQKALTEIHRVLRQRGVYIMLEAFTDGLHEMNEARREVGLAPTPMPFHNRFFNKTELFPFMECFDLVRPHSSNFLSSYYYGSRVLYPALIKPAEPKYNTSFVKFFADLPPHGNYSSIQCYVFRKR